MDILRKIVKHINPSLIAKLLAFAVLTAFLEVVSVWALRSLFLVCLGQMNPLANLLRALLPKKSAFVDILLVFLCSVFLFILLKNIFFAWLWRKVLRRLAVEQSNIAWHLFEHYLRAPFATQIKRSWSVLQHNLSMVGNQLFIRLIFPMLLAVSEALVLAGILLFLLIKAPIITVLLTLWLGGTMYVFRLRSVRFSLAAGKGRDRSSERMLRLTHESLSDAKSIKLWACEVFFVDLYRKNAKDLARYLADDRFMMQLPRFVFEPTLIGGLVVLYVVLIGTHAPHWKVLANLTLYAAAAVRILPAAQRLISQMHLLAFDYSNISTIVADLEQETEKLQERPRHVSTPPFECFMVFDNVSLGYSSGKTVLHNVNLTIKRGDKIAIVGKTGAGKTSFINTLLGFCPPIEGRILFDDVEAAPLPRFRQSSMAYVQQDVFLLDGSIIENVAFATVTDDVDETRIWDSLRRAQLEDKMRGLPDGLNARFGENGISLSGGERQRLALARAFYQRSAFLVLDEATSQLDVATETAILTDLFEHHPEITLLVVTHRASTAKRFDRCLRVENGLVYEYDRQS